MRKKRIKNSSGNPYWQSIADIMSGLLMVLLLIVMLFMTRVSLFTQQNTGETTEGEKTEEYNLQTDQSEKADKDNKGDHEFEEGYDNDHTDDHQYDEPSNGGGGGSGNVEEPLEVPKGEEEDGQYAAVLVRLLDVDSEKPVEEAGIRFDLRNDRQSTLVLKSYYPEEITYSYYDTRPDGTFFLPEKLPYGQYTIHNLTPATGYETAADVEFSVDKSYHWNSPLIVNAYVGPEKNVLYIQLVNAEGEPVQVTGKFKVYAEEDITTGDGTIRAKKGKKVDTIKCNKEGYGVSAPLYPGKYRIETSFDEDFYAGSKSNSVTLSAKGAEDGEQVQEITCEKTTINLQLSDELYSSIPVQGAEFELVNKSTQKKKTAVTDEQGSLSFTNLAKNTVFELRQTKAVPHYYEDTETSSITVDGDGYIEGSAVANLTKTNRMIRVSINLVDTILNMPVKGVAVDLYDEAGNPVINYTSDGNEKLIEGISYGRYHLVSKETSLDQWIDIDNSAKVQNIKVKVYSTNTILILVLAGIILLIIIITIIFLLSRRRKQRN